MITLTKQEQKIYRYWQLALIIFAIISLLYFLKELIFPTQIFNYFQNSNSLANTITKPYPTENGTVFDVSLYGDFDKAKVIITLDNKVKKLPKHTTIKLRKSYASFLSPKLINLPESQKINTYEIEGKKYLLKNEMFYPFVSEEAFNSYLFKNHHPNTSIEIFNQIPKNNDVIGFASGSLLAIEDEGAYVIEDGKRRAIDDELTWRAFGFNDETFVNREELNTHQKAKMFSMQSHHPNGTIFYATDTATPYLFQDHNLYKLANHGLKRMISVQEESQEIYAECQLKKGLRKYKCTIPLENIKKFDGNFYEFSVIDIPDLKARQIQIKFYQELTKQNPIDRLSEIKKSLLTQYSIQ
jgi:hypothetical protein